MLGALVPTLSAVAVVSLLAAEPDWYPRQCVIDNCAIVDHVTWVPAAAGRPPQMLISSIHGTAIVRNDFAVLRSADERFHVCVRYDAFGSLEVTCLLVPAGGFRAYGGEAYRVPVSPER